MPTISQTVDIDFDLDDLDTDDLIDELRSRGYSINKDISDFDEDEMIDELKSRGYIIHERSDGPQKIIPVQDLYTTYLTMSPEFFQEELKRFFRINLDVSEY